MDRDKIMRYGHKLCSGVTLIELITSMAIALIIILTASVLLVSGNRSWIKTYNSAHKQIKVDAQMVMLTFGSVGRKSNRSVDPSHLGYIIYKITGSTFTPAVSATPSVDTVVPGDAVEFRYWDVDLDKGDTHQLVNDKKIATAYALFYLDSGQIKVDYGPYNWVTNTGAIPPGPGGGVRNTSGVHTLVLARNVTADPNIKIFSHTTQAGNGAGKGCVRMDAILTDPADGDKIKVMTSVMMRNIWPK